MPIQIWYGLGGLVHGFEHWRIFWNSHIWRKWTGKKLPHPRPLKKLFCPCLARWDLFVTSPSSCYLFSFVPSGPCGRTVQSTLKRLSFIIVQITCYIATEDNTRPFSLTIKAESCPISLKESPMVSIFHLLYSFLLFLLYLFLSILYHTLCLLNFIN